MTNSWHFFLPQIQIIKKILLKFFNRYKSVKSTAKSIFSVLKDLIGIESCKLPKIIDIIDFRAILIRFILTLLRKDKRIIKIFLLK